MAKNPTEAPNDPQLEAFKATVMEIALGKAITKRDRLQASLIETTDQIVLLQQVISQVD